jgi:hypothetical protein
VNYARVNVHEIFFVISEGLIGMAVTGGVVLAIGGLVGLGIALSKSK